VGSENRKSKEKRDIPKCECKKEGGKIPEQKRGMGGVSEENHLLSW
jgi:hypothetical protein